MSTIRERCPVGTSLLLCLSLSLFFGCDDTGDGAGGVDAGGQLRDTGGIGGGGGGLGGMGGMGGAG